jgi:hypothetical protein
MLVLDELLNLLAPLIPTASQNRRCAFLRSCFPAPAHADIVSLLEHSEPDADYSANVPRIVDVLARDGSL